MMPEFTVDWFTTEVGRQVAPTIQAGRSTAVPPTMFGARLATILADAAFGSMVSSNGGGWRSDIARSTLRYADVSPQRARLVKVHRCNFEAGNI